MKLSKKYLTLYRPVGPKELALIKDSRWKRFPPRLPEQPFFYPVLTKEYAVKIAKDWNVKASGAGFVLQFQVSKKYLDNYGVQCAGGSNHQEYWIPAEDLDNFNQAIIGDIEIIETFGDS